MNAAQIWGFIGIPLSLLSVAVAINRFNLFSYLGNLTMPWLLTAVACSLLLVGAVCILRREEPNELPGRVCVAAVLLVQTIYGAGMVVDRFAYRCAPADWPASVGGWIGFGVILAAAFLLPRL